MATGTLLTVLTLVRGHRIIVENAVYQMSDRERAACLASLEAVRALVIALAETGQVDAEVLRAALEDAAESQRALAEADEGGLMHRRVASILDDLTRDTYAVDK